MSVLAVKDVFKKINKKEILKDISFEIQEGEIVGFVGPNGAGKTTTIKTIVGILAQDSGLVSINNKSINRKSDLIKAMEDISCMIENPALYDYLSGYENLKQIVRADKRLSEKDIDEVVKLVNLSDSINEKVKKYSLGMKQRLAIAEALITKPKLLILDEPTNGLDPIGIVEIRKLLRSICKEKKTTILISSHILGELEQLCDRIIFINEGKIFSKEGRDKDGYINMIIIPKDKDECEAALKDIDIVKEISSHNNGFLIRITSDNVSELIYKLSDKRGDINEIYRYRETLEEKYMEVYSN